MSKTEKSSRIDRYRRFGGDIIVDRADMSFFRRPAYYIVHGDKEDLIVIRGSCVSDDFYTDLDYY